MHSLADMITVAEVDHVLPAIVIVFTSPCVCADSMGHVITNVHVQTYLGTYLHCLDQFVVLVEVQHQSFSNLSAAQSPCHLSCVVPCGVTFIGGYCCPCLPQLLFQGLSLGAGFGLLTSVQVVPLWSRCTGDMRRVCVCV